MFKTRNTVNKSILALAVAGSLASAQTALAYEAGDFIVRAGAAIVDPNESSSEITIETLSLGAAAGTAVGVDSDVQLGITFSYMFTNEFGVELLAATPFQHHIYGKGVLGGAGNLGKTKHLPPTLNFNYYPNDATSKFQPYIGIGLNYTTFFDTSATSTLDNPATIDALANLTANAPGAGTVTSAMNTDIELDDSFGLAIQLGFDLQLTENMGINAAYWRADIDTEGTVTTDTNLGKVSAKVDVDIDPSVYMIGLYYRF
jgi:outer membrane protein